MKKKAKYLGIPCFYDEDERKIIGRNPILSPILWIAIVVDNFISWVYWKFTTSIMKKTKIVYTAIYTYLLNEYMS